MLNTNDIQTISNIHIGSVGFGGNSQDLRWLTIDVFDDFIENVTPNITERNKFVMCEILSIIFMLERSLNSNGLRCHMSDYALNSYTATVMPYSQTRELWRKLKFLVRQL